MMTIDEFRRRLDLHYERTKPPAEDIDSLFASLSLALTEAMAAHKMDVIFGLSSKKLAAYCLSCLAALNEANGRE